MLNGKNIKTKRPAKKLDKKMYGPYVIQKVISPTAVKLKLPKNWRIHNSFHVSLIEPHRAGNQVPPDPDQVLRDAEPIESEYTVEEIMGSVEVQGIVKYHVKWENYPKKKDWTWEPYDNFEGEGAKEIVRQYHLQHPGTPADPRALSTTDPR